MLNPSFTFSQHSLRDYADCPRRLYLRYIARQPWPVVETGPMGLNPLEYQAYLWRGTVLHRWIERYWLGVPTQSSNDTELNLWWARFMGTNFDALPAQRLPELALVAPLGNYLLYARFDLLAIGSPSHLVEGNRAVIVDWKTVRGDHPPRYQVFAERFQTRIYLYVLATAGAAFNGGLPFAPEQCSMRYWLANFPEQAWVDIPYSVTEYERDRQMLLGLIEKAAHHDCEEQFMRTENERHCTYCTYLTLCRRNGVPQAVQTSDAWFDIDAVAELDF